MNIKKTVMLYAGTVFSFCLACRIFSPNTNSGRQALIEAKAEVLAIETSAIDPLYLGNNTTDDFVLEIPETTMATMVNPEATTPVTLPETAVVIPETTILVPETTATIPETVPETTIVIPETQPVPETVPETTAVVIPETTIVIPETIPETQPVPVETAVAIPETTAEIVVSQTIIPETALAVAPEYTDEQKLLATVIMAEAEDQSELGKRLAIDVILNRVDSREFPNTISEVVYQKDQFKVFTDGRINVCYPKPDILVLVAQEMTARTNNEVLYFRTKHYFDGLTPVLHEDGHWFSK